MVTVRSTGVGAGMMERVHEQQARNLLRALHLGIGDSCTINMIEATSDTGLFRVGDSLAYDSYADDMGNHPGHDTAVIRGSA